jgi:hypothetical protein
MATIKISDLQLAGHDLFSDSETYLRDLSDDELGIEGGIAWTTVTVSSKPCISASAAVATFIGSYVYTRL